MVTPWIWYRYLETNWGPSGEFICTRPLLHNHSKRSVRFMLPNSSGCCCNLVFVYLPWNAVTGIKCSSGNLTYCEVRKLCLNAFDESASSKWCVFLNTSFRLLVKRHTKFRKLALLPSSCESIKPSLLGPGLRSLALSIGPNRLGFILSRDDRSRVSFRNVCVCFTYSRRKMPKTMYQFTERYILKVSQYTTMDREFIFLANTFEEVIN
jgi:hypothetical protein